MSNLTDDEERALEETIETAWAKAWDSIEQREKAEREQAEHEAAKARVVEQYLNHDGRTTEEIAELAHLLQGKTEADLASHAQRLAKYWPTRQGATSTSGDKASERPAQAVRPIRPSPLADSYIRRKYVQQPTD